MFRIKEILHSGRKGIRGEPVDDYKYDGLVGCYAEFDINDIRAYQGVHMVISGHSFYDWWHTSPVIQLTRRNFNVYELETVNTIYILEEME